ncbi:MAG: guanylate kinase [Clostridia bacterium]|nr:guanylate kinase [Clostridia bacterium]
MRKGTLLVLSGPSGSGKGTLVKEYTDKYEDVFVSVSATTRNPREGERYGVNYFFLTVEEFKKKIEENGFLEYAQFCENYYGTPRESVEKKLNEGMDVILEIDVQGAFQVKENCPDAVLVFTIPPSYEILRQRLIGRGTESMEVIEKRLNAAVEEFRQAEKYDYIIINDKIETAAEELRAIFVSEKCRMKNNQEFTKGVLNNVIS